MTTNDAAALYDALQAFESRYRRAGYPVHKRLTFAEPGIDDIYDWIIQTVGLPDSGPILDAGCGVGFGAIRMAAATAGSVTGISISPAEIAAAREAQGRSCAAERLAFVTASFDDPPTGPYALITAVESLKHSTDIERTRVALQQSLAADGTLVIVEDCYSGPDDDVDASRLIESWRLTRLYTETDFTTWPDRLHCDVIRLDNYLAAGNLVARAGGWLGRLLRRASGASGTAQAAFAGGECLDRLYAKRLMHYTAFVIRAGSKQY